MPRSDGAAEARSWRRVAIMCHEETLEETGRLDGASFGRLSMARMAAANGGTIIIDHVSQP